MRSHRALTALMAGTIVVIAGVVTMAGIGRHTDRIRIGDRWFERTELRVNRFTQSQQAHVALDMDGAGNVVATWDSRRQQDGTYGVYARWIDASGSVRGPEEQVNLFTTSMQERPAVALSGDGEPRFVWTSYGQDGDQGSIISRSIGAEHPVNMTVAGSQTDAAVASLAGGRVVTVWSSVHAAGDGATVAYRILDPDHVGIGDTGAGDAGNGDTASGSVAPADTGVERWVDVAAGRVDRLPAVAALGADGFVVVWSRARTDGVIEGVMARCFDDRGEPTTGVVPVSIPGQVAIEPSVTATGRDGFIVVWLGRAIEDPDYDVHMCRFRPDGARIGAPKVATERHDLWQSGAAVAAAPDGRFVVAWNNDDLDRRDADVLVRFFDADARPITGDVRVTRHADGEQRLAVASGARRIALGTDGRLAVAWEGDSGMGDATSASVTLLIPTANEPLADVRAGLDVIGDRLWARRSAPPGRDDDGYTEEVARLDAAAAPHLPPTYGADVPASEPRELVRTAESVAFTGFTNTGWNPADPHLAAGPAKVLLIGNGAIVLRDKSNGVPVFQASLGGALGFWGSTGAGQFVFDPEVLYDDAANRFLAMANERTDGRSYLLLGISKTSQPVGSGSNDWYKFRFDVTALGGDDIDSPNLAVDDEAIYLSADFFDPDTFLLYIIDKASVLNGGTPITRTLLHAGTQSFAFSVMESADAPRMYMVEALEGEPQTMIRLWAIHDPLGSPWLESTILTVPTYYEPPIQVPSQGTSMGTVTFGSRFWSAMYRAGSIWACHQISLSPSPRRAAARWYQLVTNGWPLTGETPELAQSGTVDGGPGVHLTFNAIGVDDVGDAMMVFARSGLNEYFSMARSFRLAGDPPGTMFRGPDIMAQSTGVFNVGRWGDYGSAMPDPVLSQVFWMHHMYAPLTGVWHTWVVGEDISDAPIAIGPGESPEAAPASSDAGARLSVTPNPTPGATSIGFSLRQAAEIRIEIYDVAGRLVRSLTPGALGIGSHRISWNGRDEAGAGVADGVYAVRVIADGLPMGRGRLVVAR